MISIKLTLIDSTGHSEPMALSLDKIVSVVPRYFRPGSDTQFPEKLKQDGMDRVLMAFDVTNRQWSSRDASDAAKQLLEKIWESSL